MATPKYSSYEEYIKNYALSNENVIVMTAENRALIRSLPPILKERFVDTGITEQTMVGAAAGLALRGRKPILHALATFLTMRAFEFIRTDVGISGAAVKLTSFVPGFLSDGNGPTHQAVEDIALMRSIPGMEIYAAADNTDMLLMLETIWDTDKPAYVRVNTRPAQIVHQNFEPGKAEVLSRGKDVTILVYGMLLEEALTAQKILQEKGIDVGLANMRSLRPVDEQFLLQLANEKGLVVTLEDHFITGGLFSIYADLLAKHQKTVNILPISLDNKWYKPGTLDQVLVHEGFTGSQIANRITAHLKN